jgi:hypothetical protein
MKTLTITAYLLLIIFTVWVLGVGSGRNWSLVGKEEFVGWHQKNGRVMKILGFWGAAICSFVLVARLVEFFR